MGKGPPFLPEEIANIHGNCPNCGRIVRPNLWKECEFPFTPAYPDGTKGEKSAWIRVSTTITCECGKKLEFPLNFKKLEHPFFIHHEEHEGFCLIPP